jgi:hypothetical protein
LLAVGDADVTIEARNGADAFVNIVSSPIDLSGFTADVEREYDIRITAASPIEETRRFPIWLAVARSVGIDFAA